MNWLTNWKTMSLIYWKKLREMKCIHLNQVQPRSQNLQAMKQVLHTLRSPFRAYFSHGKLMKLIWIRKLMAGYQCNRMHSILPMMIKNKWGIRPSLLIETCRELILICRRCQKTRMNCFTMRSPFTMEKW